MKIDISKWLLRGTQEPDFEIRLAIYNELRALKLERNYLREQNARMQKALDDIYNHNEAARAAVVQHYGTAHDDQDQE